MEWKGLHRSTCAQVPPTFFLILQSEVLPQQCCSESQAPSTELGPGQEGRLLGDGAFVGDTDFAVGSRDVEEIA